MTLELALSWCRSREATITYVAVADAIQCRVSALNGALRGQSEDFPTAVEQCVAREKQLIAAGKISPRTPLMARIIEWHAEQEQPPEAIIDGHCGGGAAYDKHAEPQPDIEITLPIESQGVVVRNKKTKATTQQD